MRYIFSIKIFMILAVILAVQDVMADIKIGILLPYSGAYAPTGVGVDNGFKLYLDQHDGKLGGQKVKIYKVDDEANPSKGIENSKILIDKEQVDIAVGTAHSGVAMALAKVAKEKDTTVIIPIAGAAALTGALCSENLFRVSFTNWQPAYAVGIVAGEKKYKTAVTITWKYTAGQEAVDGFKESFEKSGGKVVKELYVPQPQMEFQTYLTEIAAMKPDMVFAFFPGPAGAKLLREYSASGLKDDIPLLSTFTTDGTLSSLGKDGDGYLTAGHYADDLNNPTDIKFKESYKKMFGVLPDLFAVQGYDAAQLIDIGLTAVKGDITKKKEFRKAMRDAELDSPRGKFKLSAAGNPVQNFYLRKSDGGLNKVVKLAVANLNDPGVGCALK